MGKIGKIGTAIAEGELNWNLAFKSWGLFKLSEYGRNGKVLIYHGFNVESYDEEHFRIDDTCVSRHRACNHYASSRRIR